MPKMKWGDNEPDWDELDDAEYEDGPERYTGPIPPKNTILEGSIKKAWATESQAGNKMFKVVWEAEGNTGDKKQYNGLSIWDNVVWTPQTKFRWQPWLDALGIDLRDVRQRTITAEGEDNVGLPIIRINKLKFPAEVRIVTDTDSSYNNELRAKVAEWLPPSDLDADDDAEDDDEIDDDEPPF